MLGLIVRTLRLVGGCRGDWVEVGGALLKEEV